MTQNREAPDLDQRLDEIAAYLKRLQQSVADLHGLEQTLLREVQVIKQAQTGQADTLEQVKKELYRGRWWRRLALLFRLLIIVVVVAVALYFLADWQKIFQFFI